MADIVADAVMQSIMTSPLERAGGEVVGSQSSRSLQDGDGDEHKTLSKQFSYSKVWRNSYGPKLLLGEELEGSEEQGSLTSRQILFRTYSIPILYLSQVPGSLICLLIALIPFGDPSDGFGANISFGLIFTLILPLLYSMVLDWMTSSGLGIRFTWRRNLGMSITASALTFILNAVLAGLGKYPLDYSFCYFFLMVCCVQVIWSLCSIWKSIKQKKEKKRFKSTFVLLFQTTLLLGWSFSALTMKYFNSSNMIVQTLIMTGLAIWKCLTAQCIKIYSLMAKQHGEKYEVMLVSFWAISVHWFWTLFTNLAFAAVESWLTFVAYLVIDITAAFAFMYQCSDHYQKKNRSLEFPNGGWIPRLVVLEDSTSSYSSLDRSYDVLFNCWCFVLIQFGELTFAVYTILLFTCCRLGPNSAHSPLGRISEGDFINLLGFLIVIIFTEVLCLFVFLRRFSVKRFFKFDPRPYIGDFLMQQWPLVVVTPVVLHFPCLMFMFDHSGMGYDVGGAD